MGIEAIEHARGGGEGAQCRVARQFVQPFKSREARADTGIKLHLILIQRGLFNTHPARVIQYTFSEGYLIHIHIQQGLFNTHPARVIQYTSSEDYLIHIQ